MNTRHSFRWLWAALAVVCLTIPFFPYKAATQQGAAAGVNVKIDGGLTVVTFTVNPGTVMVKLPDDIRAGDTISGTVICEPKGNTKEERGANQSELNKLGVKLIFGPPEQKPEEVSCGDVAVPFKGLLFQDDKRAVALSLVVALFVKLGNTLAQASIPVQTYPSGAIITPDPKITPPTHPSGAIITPDPKITQPTHPSGAIITPDPKITAPKPPTHPSGAIITPDPKITQPTHPSGAIITPDPKITAPKPPTHPSGAIITPDPKITQPTHPSGAIITPDPKITAPKPPTHPSGAIITPDPKITQPTHPSGAIITPDPKITNPPFSFPPVGQTGRPIEVSGFFDGDSSNTKLELGTGEERDTMGRFDVIAESPRKAIFRAPANVIGPVTLHLTEGNTKAIGRFRNVAVDLTAPKTSLLKGESTELRIQVSGLEGLTQPVPLTLECKGVITMTGGNYQPLTIQPSQVGVDGSYSTTRGITGVQAGGWGATATVVTTRFNVCLQDDTAPARRVLWNTFTGDYVFINPFPPPKPPGQPPQTGDTTSPTLTGKGKMVMKGCILTLNHNAPDRRVFSRLDTCTTSGTSTIEDPKTKVKATITDGNITDNTCPSE